MYTLFQWKKRKTNAWYFIALSNFLIFFGGGGGERLFYDFYCRHYLRCPETLFNFHENANFLFSVFRVVQGDAKTPKIIGCCRANFAFLHALKIGTFRGKWTLEWVFKTSQFVCLSLYFLITSKLDFIWLFFNATLREQQKTLDLESRTEQKKTFCFYDWKPS